MAHFRGRVRPKARQLSKILRTAHRTKCDETVCRAGFRLGKIWSLLLLSCTQLHGKCWHDCCLWVFKYHDLPEHRCLRAVCNTRCRDLEATGDSSFGSV